jgi:hypothetical protein
MALLDEKPLKGKVLLRTMFLMLLRLKLERPELLVEVLVELEGTDECADGGDPGEHDDAGELSFGS